MTPTTTAQDLIRAIDNVESQLKKDSPTTTQKPVDTLTPQGQELTPTTLQQQKPFDPELYRNSVTAKIGNWTVEYLTGIKGIGEKTYFGESLAGVFEKYFKGSVSTPEGQLALSLTTILAITYLQHKEKKKNKKEKENDNIPFDIKKIISGTDILGHGM